MRFLRRSGTTTEESPQAAQDADASSIESHTNNKGYTPGKGRATPSRREAEGKRRGPVAPPPRTMREAMKRNKELRKANPNYKAERRAEVRERQRRMAEGDERYLLPRDRGPVKAHVRDLVDSRRNFAGLFMPMGVLMIVLLVVPLAIVQQYGTLLFLVLLLSMAVDGFLSGRRISRQVRAKFPKETISGRSVGWYAFVRSTQIRKLRIPKPRVKPGDTVS
ncbi:DUF3043 domain-containing protein [Amycolatopsis taiwanensis]|uniref:DUF3043 domain-containing protein n=1 Tax=Amycolatopsis taiwanensis TaxID=342230 RepID=A0A9W6QZ12_9PSEU|nr:DUF3043 domain-containing protein [Amycolatopsis taiwanensis]GLY66164.1 hypothetical protein Atai01_27830 [Amycolatopsis taiwanensis]